MAQQVSTVPTNAEVVDAPSPAAGKSRRPKKGQASGHVTWRKALAKDWRLYTFLVIPIIYFLIFRYVPMVGNVIAFRRYVPGGNPLGEYWVGFQYFERFFGDPTFWKVFRNTVIMGGLTLLFTFPAPLIFALMLNELRSQKFKKFVQTASYLPHFLSLVIVAGMVLQLVAANGTINQLIGLVGIEPINFIQEAGWFRSIYVSSQVWQTMGWGAILYLATLSTIDESLYEAAKIDGANRWKQTLHVTIPGLIPTIMVLLILNIGSFMAVGFEKILLLYNPLTYETADVISTYLYRVGLLSGNFSYATAIGIFEAVIGLILVMSANVISRRVAGTSLW